jgi:MFS transporter, PPP family, 3-phenylpropionic acid transporter
MPSAISLRLAFFYAAIFIAFGVQLPYWPLWLGARGLSAEEIGAVGAIGQWVKGAATPLAGYAADRSGNPRRTMLLLSLGAACGFLLCLPARGLASLLLLSAATGASLSALNPLGDTLALSASAEGKLDYGRARLWGSLAFIASSVLAGQALQGHGPEWVLYLLIGAGMLTTAACLALPAGNAVVRRVSPLRWRALLSARFLVFLIAAALVQGSHSVFYLFSTLHWRALGYGEATIAALWAEGVVAEILLFYWGAPLLRRIGPLGLIALGGAAGLVRWTVTAFATGLPVLALAQLLHALTFAATHLGAMHHLVRTVPPEQAATGQGIYGVSVGAIGPGLIMLLAGSLYGSVGGLAYLAMAAIAALGGALALGLAATKS